MPEASPSMGKVIPLHADEGAPAAAADPVVEAVPALDTDGEPSGF